MSLPLRIDQLLAFEDSAALDRLALRMRVGKSATHCDLTFRDLALLAGERGGALLRQGCRPGERVALLMPHTLELVQSFFGALYVGLVPCILAWPTAKMDAEKYRRNVTTVVGRLDARWLVTDRGSADKLGHHLGGTTVVDPEELSRSPEPALAAPGRAGTLFIQFSGGTTGAQKSVPIEADRLQAQLGSYASRLALCADDRLVSWLPLYHDMGLVACLLLPFLYRLPVSMFAPMEWVMDPRSFLEHVAVDRSTLTWQPNFAFSFMATRISKPTDAIDLRSLRGLINCSEPVRAESMDAFAATFAAHGLRKGALSSCYAMAEATFAVTQTPLGRAPLRLAISRRELGQGRVALDGAPDARVLVSSGPVIEGAEVRVVDDAGKDVGSDRTGEIWIRAPFVMSDYLAANEGAPRHAFEGDWYKSGDLGTLRDGELFVTGRKKDVIIVGGVNVFPEDVETAVFSVDGVHAGRAVAMGLVDAAAGTERLVVVAELDREEDAQRADAIEAAARAAVMADCGIAPAAIFLVPPKWIVKSTAGKTSRSETKARLLSNWAELNQGKDARFDPQADGT